VPRLYDTDSERGLRITFKSSSLNTRELSGYNSGGLSVLSERKLQFPPKISKQRKLPERIPGAIWY